MKIVEFLGEDGDKFMDKDYCIFDPILYKGIHNFLDNLGVEYFSLGLNYFKKNERCPILINLKNIELNKKEEFFEVIVNTIEMNGKNPLDRNAIANVFFDSDLGNEKIIDLLKKMMVFRNQLFRFYDSRVLMFINVFLSGSENNLNFFKELSPEGWYFSCNGGFFKVNFIFKKYKRELEVFELTKQYID